MTNITFIISYGYLIALLLFIALLWRTSKNPNIRFNWVDLISNPDGSASLTRTLQLIAGITSTWVIIKLTITAAVKIDYFLAYLAAMGISEGFNKWIQTRKADKDGNTTGT